MYIYFPKTWIFLNNSEAALARASASSSSSGSNSAKANFFSKHFNPPTTNRPSASQTRSYAAASVQGNMV